MTDPIEKTVSTVTDINSYDCPFICARLTTDQVGRLRRDPNVSLVQEDYQWHALEEVQGWQIPFLRVPEAWNPPLSMRGSGVNVAIMDTGVNPHIDLPNLRVNQNFTARSGTGAEDPNRHGTHVAGLVGAAQGNNEGIQGVAPSCNIWNLRAGDQNGLFSFADSLEALQYANQNSAHVVNMSFGGVAPAGPLDDAFQQAINAGFAQDILYVGAAGNTGQQEVNFTPAGYLNVIAITNLQSNGALFPGQGVGSSWGTYVDLTAPGTDIVSLAENNLYRSLTGTSMACPAASGLFALCVGAYNSTPPGCPPRDPSVRRNQTVAVAVAETATKSGLSNAGPAGQKDIRYGYGYPLAGPAVASLKGVLPSALI